MSGSEPVAKRRPAVLRIGAVIAAAAVLVIVAMLVFGGDDEPGVARSAPVAVSLEELREAGDSVDVPIFWAGARSGSTYELTRSDDGSVFVRYLPDGVEVGDPRPNFLTVATYAIPNGYPRVQAAARAPGADVRELRDGGVAVVNDRRETSVYVAYPRGGYQVEVFEPTPGRALDLAVSEVIRPVR